MNLEDTFLNARTYLQKYGWTTGRFHRSRHKKDSTPPQACVLGALQTVTSKDEDKYLYPKACGVLRRMLELEPGVSIAAWNDSADGVETILEALAAAAARVKVSG